MSINDNANTAGIQCRFLVLSFLCETGLYIIVFSWLQFEFFALLVKSVIMRVVQFWYPWSRISLCGIT